MNNIWLIGAGNIAHDYIKAFQKQNVNLTVIGRSEHNCKKLEAAFELKVVQGGIDKYLDTTPKPCSHAFVAVDTKMLFDVTKVLIIYGIKNILVEKPGALHDYEFYELNNLAQSHHVNLFIAYNRRFYSSVLEAEKMIEEDGGVTSFNFEFTEWSHVIEPLKKAEGTKERWFTGNSTHVVDLAFFIGGDPKEISTFTSGSLSWHPSSSIFSGAGISSKGALFNYGANWESAGRWSVEVLTQHRKFIFCPMEKLHIQKRGTIAIEEYKLPDTIDTDYKAGLFREIEAFLSNDYTRMCSFDEQCNKISLYNQMANY